ncbi:MAG TPA: penicillin-binding protein 2 [Candidatus Paceibacterota bacterium]|nr:penicillin-binding protein 2 [Candidatus Paceibacterota bacterium]HRZ99654.1 penicillin-binding protein 2 [Candidatus Paceibacterota bacterium]
MMLSWLMGLSFLGLGYRLVDLQVVRHEEFVEKARNNTDNAVLFQPQRGNIVDIRGNLLATCVPVKTVWADPSLIGEHQLEVARVLAPSLKLPEDFLVQELSPRPITNAQGVVKKRRYKVLARKVPLETWQQITQGMASLTFGVDEKKLRRSQQESYKQLRSMAIQSDDDQLRLYPNHRLAAHVLGHVGVEESEVNDRPVLEIVGRDGIEQTMNASLRGIYGWRKTSRDAGRRELVVFRDQDIPPRHGYNVVLTLDARIQDILETELMAAVAKHTPLTAHAIMVRPATGEILAMTSWPNFDPNEPGKSSIGCLKNRMIADQFEPGSTFKICAVSAALHEGLIHLDDLIDCENGRFYYGGRPLKEHESHGYGLLSISGVLMKSSNIGTAKIGLRLGSQKLYDYMLTYGFGARTGIPLPGEADGLVNPIRKWSKPTITRVAIGQSVAVTAIQMMMAMSAIANEGRLMQPMLVHGLTDQQGNELTRYSPKMVRQVVRESVAKDMVAALKTVVSTNGTGSKARLPYYTVAGKTGTGQKPINGVYVPGKYVASFIGFFPADQPEVCLGVFFDEPKNGYYGGTVAAPVFKAMAERVAAYLGLRPDITPVEAMTDARSGSRSAKSRM